jgi:hypothetical protein
MLHVGMSSEMADLAFSGAQRWLATSKKWLADVERKLSVSWQGAWNSLYFVLFEIDCLKSSATLVTWKTSIKKWLDASCIIDTEIRRHYVSVILGVADSAYHQWYGESSTASIVDRGVAV